MIKKELIKETKEDLDNLFADVSHFSPEFPINKYLIIKEKLNVIEKIESETNFQYYNEVYEKMDDFFQSQGRLYDKIQSRGQKKKKIVRFVNYFIIFILMLISYIFGAEFGF